MHDAILADLPAYAAGTLAPADRRRLDAHLADCAACRLELAQWQALAAAARRQVAERTVTVPAWVSPVDGQPVPAGGAGPARRLFPLLALLLALGLAGRLALRAADPSGDAGSGDRRAAGSLLAGRTGGGLGDLGIDPGGAANTLPRSTEPQDLAVSPRPGHPLGEAEGSAYDRQSAEPARTMTGTMPEPSRGGSGLALANLAANRPVPPSGAGTAGRPPTLSTTEPTADPGIGPQAPASPASTSAPPRGDPGGHEEPPKRDPTVEPVDPPARSAPSDSPTPLSLPTETVTPVPPTTTPPSQGVLSGRVHGPDGQPRAEIDVYADPLDPAQAGRKASTGSDGGYQLELPPGRWLLHAETAAYQLMWYGGSPNPLLAEPLDIAAGQNRRADFYLEPSPPGLIRGQVLDAEGRPLARALVLAAYPPDGEAGGPRLVWSVFSGPDGSFSLALPPGYWFLAGAADWRDPRLRWWGGDGAWESADGLVVTEAALEGVRLVVGP